MVLEYDIIIATKDRPAALRLSLPRILGQSRLPRTVIVVDSSDDLSATKDVIHEVAGTCQVDIEIVESSPGLPRQRNLGLSKARSPVVMFPDDDSIWFPDTAEAIMRVYELDTENQISAVCTAEARTPPSDFLEGAAPAYQMQASHRLKQHIGHARTKFEQWAFPDPFVVHGRSQWETAPRPAWLDAENVVLVEWMTGFRMSFRTDVIRETGFDENFGGYALFEDVEASFGAMQKGLVVGTRNTQVYHHRMPGGRGSERRLGVTQILNRAYVICRHTAPGDEARQRLLPYGRYKLAQYALRLGSSHGRERFEGAWAAQGHVPKLLAASPEELPAVYQLAVKASLNSE